MRAYLWLTAVLALAGCMTAGEHRAALDSESDQRLTVGKVQREIRVGMSGAEVAQVLGTPNIVTTDEERREVWVYDRVSSESVHSESRGGIAALIFGGDVFVGGTASTGAGARSSTQRTLTVVIKFDREARVRDFSYHATQF